MNAQKSFVRALRVACALATTAALLTACGDGEFTPREDDPDAVTGGDVDAGGGDDVDESDTDGPGDTADGDGADTVEPTPSIDFYIEIAGGNALQGATSSVELDVSDDLYPGLADPKVQVDVVISAENIPDGTLVDVRLNNVSVGTATIDAGTAELEKVTIECASGPAPFSLGVVTTIDGDAVERAKNVRVTCEGGCTAALDGLDACYATDADGSAAGFQIELTVTTTTPDCTHAFITYTDASGQQGQTDKVLLSNGSANVFVTVADEGAVLDAASATVQAVVEDQAHPDRPTGSSAEETLKITTETPTVTINQPTSGTLTLIDDADGDATNGVQVTLVGTAKTLTTADVDAIELFVNGSSQGTTTLEVSDEFTFALSFAQSTGYKVRVDATNSCGLVGSAEVDLTVFVDEAALAIGSPASGSVLLAKDDGDAVTDSVYETSFDVSLQSATPGATVTAECRTDIAGTVFAAVGSAQVPDPAPASLSIAVALDTAALGNQLVCRVRDDAPNAAQSAEATFTVGLPAPCLSLALPLDGAVVSGNSVSVTGSGTSLDGRPVSVRLENAQGLALVDTTLGTMGGGQVFGSVGLVVGNPPTSVPDGTYTLVLGASDDYGNLAADSACSALSRTISIDNTGPGISLIAPSKSSLDPVNDPDSAPGTLGFQQDFELGVSGEADLSGVEVCLTVGGFEVGCGNPAQGAQTVTFEDVTLQPGANTVNATATDAVGNPTALTETTITLVSNAVVVEWVEPTGSVTIPSDSITVRAKVTNQNDGTPIFGASGEIYLGGQVTNTQVVETPGGIYEAVVGGLQPGLNELQMGVTPQVGGDPGISPKLAVTVKTTLPGIQLDTPADGSIFNLASNACVPGVANCILDVTATATDIAEGQDASLDVVCGANSAAYDTTVGTNGAVTFASVVLTNNSSCTLTAGAIDKAGQQASSAPATVTVDRTAPKINGIPSPVGSTLLASGDADSFVAGMQVNLSVSVSGLAKAAVVSAEIFEDDGTKVGQTLTASPANAVGDAGTGLVNFGLVSLPDGDAVKIAVSTADAVGNPVSFEKFYVVKSTSPEVRLTSPNYVQPKACTKKSDCGVLGACIGGTCALPWNKNTAKTASVATLGLPDGAAVRICAKAAGLSGAACATSGYVQVATATGENGGASLSLAALADNDYELIAEASFLPAVDWVASVDSQLDDTKLRRIVLDTVAPVITSVLPPQVQGVPSGCLSAASQTQSDLGAAGGTFTFAVTTQTEEATVSLLVGGASVASAATSNKLAGITATLAEGAAVISAQATDAVGNVSASVSGGTFTVNTVAPTGGFAAPVKDKLIIGDSLDISVASTSADVVGELVTLKDNDVQEAQKAFTNQAAIQAVFDHASFGVLEDGTHTLTAEFSDDCGNPASAQIGPIVVDTTAPTGSITAPSAAQVFENADDADVNAGGFQVSATYGTSGASSYVLTLGVNCDGQFANCSGFLPLKSADVTNDGGDEPAFVFSVPFGDTTNYVLRLQTTDENGNTNTVNRNFSINISGCLVSLKGLPSSGQFSNQDCAQAGVDCASVTATAEAEYLGQCGSPDAIVLLVGGQEVETKAPVDSKATFTFTLNDGDEVGVAASVREGGQEAGNSGTTNVEVDASSPTVAFATATVLGFETPASGSAPGYGTADDQDPATSGHQLHLRLTASDANLVGGALTTVTRTVGGNSTTLPNSSVSFPSTFTLTSATRDINFASLVENQVNTIEATVTDAFGNTATATVVATVDWIAPAQLNVSITDTNPRRPAATLSFTAVGDDGAAGDAASSYQVRYSKSAITTESDWDGACDAAVLSFATIGTPKNAAEADSVVVSGPDGRDPSADCTFNTLTDDGASSWHFAVRAVDDVGNMGPINASVSTTDLRLRYAQVGGTGGDFANNFNFAFVRGVGDVDGDGTNDLLVGAQPAPKMCVVYGVDNATVADINIQSGGSGYDCIDNTDKLGWTVAPAMDVNGDGVSDIVLDSGSGNGVLREVQVFLGEQGVGVDLTSPAVTITGIVNTGNFGVRSLSSAGNFTGDTAGANPVEDIVFSVASGNGVAYERVIVVPGSAAWDTNNPTTIDVNTAGDLAANNVITIRLSQNVSGALFGSQVNRLGNAITDNGGVGTQYDELLVSQSTNPMLGRVIKGRAANGNQEIVISPANDGTGADDATVTGLRPSTSTGPNSFTRIFRVDFDGDQIPDVGAFHVPANTEQGMYWYSGASLEANLGQLINFNSQSEIPEYASTFVNAAGNAWYTVDWGNFPVNAGNFADVPGGGYSALFTTRPNWEPGTLDAMYVRLSIPRAGIGGDAVGGPLFADLAITDPVTPGNTSFGKEFAYSLGDINNDGYPDLAVGTFGGGYAVIIY